MTRHGHRVTVQRVPDQFPPYILVVCQCLSLCESPFSPLSDVVSLLFPLCLPKILGLQALVICPLHFNVLEGLCPLKVTAQAESSFNGINSCLSVIKAKLQVGGYQLQSDLKKDGLHQVYFGQVMLPHEYFLRIGFLKKIFFVYY